MIQFILQTLLGLLKLLVLIFAIIMPLMISLELFRYFGVLEKTTKFVSPITKRLGFLPDSVFPLLTGLVFGISYGAGVLISESSKGRITGNQAFLVAAYLSLCHAVFEDTLLFVAQGAVWWIIIITRLIVASIVTAIIALWLKRGSYA